MGRKSKREGVLYIYTYIHMTESENGSVVSDSLRPHRLYSPWNSPGQNTGVGSLSLLQGIFPTKGSNPGLQHCRRILYQLSYDWFTLLFSRNSHNIVKQLCSAVSLQLCPTLCDPIDGSPPGSPVPGILQARTLEWVAISFSNAGRWKVKVKSLSRVWLFATPWTAAYQAPPSMGFSRQEYWSGVPSPSPVKQLYFNKINLNNFEIKTRCWWECFHEASLLGLQTGPSCCDLPVFLLCVCPDLFFLSEHQSDKITTHPNDFILINYFLKDQIKSHSDKAMAPTPVLLPGESQGQWSLVGCRLWGRTESDTTEVT